MAISTYNELQTAVADWTANTTIPAKAVDLITLGESILNRKLRLLQMENVATLSTSTSDRFATLPTGFLEAIDLTLYADSVPQTLVQVPLAVVNCRPTDIATLPRMYSITSNIVFDVKSDQVYTCSFRYYKRLDIASDTTNWVLTNNPDLYLYAAMLSAEPYLKNDGRVTLWAQMLEEGIKQLNRLDARSRGRAMLMTEIVNTQREDITSGDY
jgi:hypothetical protein